MTSSQGSYYSLIFYMRVGIPAGEYRLYREKRRLQ